MKAIFILAMLVVPLVLWAVPLPLVPDEHHRLVVTPAHVPDDGQLVSRQFVSLQHIEFVCDFKMLRELAFQQNTELTTLELLPATFPVLRELGVQRNEQLPAFTIPGVLPAISQLYITYNPRITSLTIPGTLSTNPLIEALFMTMRGHNTNIELATEPNRTACPDGANLNILRAMPESGVGRGSFASITVAPCAGTVAAPTHDPF